MDRAKFWLIIETTIEKYEGTKESYLEELTFQLEMLSKEELILWDGYFEAYMTIANKEKLWAAAFILNKGDCNEDGFDYFKAWLISMGEEYYFEILGDVDQLAALVVSHPDKFVAKFEELVYLAQDIFIEKVARTFQKGQPDGEEAYFDYLERYPLSTTILNELLEEVTYDTDINFLWDQNHLKRVKQKIPRLRDKYVKYLDRTASKYDVSSTSSEWYD